MTGLPPEVPDGQLNISLHLLDEANRAHTAHQALARIRNTQDRRHKTMAPEILAQRKTLLDLSSRVLHSEVLEMFDVACVEYLRARGKMK